MACNDHRGRGLDGRGVGFEQQRAQHVSGWRFPTHVLDFDTAAIRLHPRCAYRRNEKKNECNDQPANCLPGIASTRLIVKRVSAGGRFIRTRSSFYRFEVRVDGRHRFFLPPFLSNFLMSSQPALDVTRRGTSPRSNFPMIDFLSFRRMGRTRVAARSRPRRRRERAFARQAGVSKPFEPLSGDRRSAFSPHQAQHHRRRCRSQRRPSPRPYPSHSPIAPPMQRFLFRFDLTCEKIESKRKISKVGRTQCSNCCRSRHGCGVDSMLLNGRCGLWSYCSPSRSRR